MTVAATAGGAGLGAIACAEGGLAMGSKDKLRLNFFI
jgi:hypothetical protein